MLKERKWSGIPAKIPTKRVSGKLWPTGEFSFGLVPEGGDERLDETPVSYCSPGDEGTAAAPPPLDLRNLPNSHTHPQCSLAAGPEGLKATGRPESYGRKGITGYGKKMVKSVGALIDRHLPFHRVTFATLTMPQLPASQRQTMAQVWPIFVNRLLQWIRRRCAAAGIPPIVVSVSEVQPKRLRDTGEGYLHLHLLWLNCPAKSGRWTVPVLALKGWVRDFWVSRGLGSVDDIWNVDVRAVKGRKANYLAKYVSKNKESVAEFAADNGWKSVPSQWWNMTKNARDWVKGELIEGGDIGELLESLVYGAFDCDDFGDFIYLYHIDVEMSGGLMNVGWRGCLTDGSRESCVDAVAFSRTAA